MAQFKTQSSCLVVDRIISPVDARTPMEAVQKAMTAGLEKYGVAGASLAMVKKGNPVKIETVCAGWAVKETSKKMGPSSWVQYASLSKTVGTTLALETFLAAGIDPVSKKVNDELRELKSSWLLEGPQAEEVTLAQLCNHTALGMHYVPGISPDVRFPSATDLILGNASHYGYEKLLVTRDPGATFKYSGGGFIVLQHVLELRLGMTIQQALAGFLEKLGLGSMAFDGTVVDDSADGYRDDGSRVPARGGLVFPALAAGGRGPPAVLAEFLQLLTRAYHGDDVNISPEVARLQLDTLCDLGSVDFMRAKAGLGVFVATAGPNKIALHQAANDGFRGLYAHCFDGPDAGAGFVLVANGDNNAMFFNANISNLVFKELAIQGLRLDRNLTDFSSDGIPQEQIVNLGYKDLLFRAFDD